MVVFMDRYPRSADSGQQRRLHTDRQEKGARNVPELWLGQGDFPVRRTAEEVPPGAVREVNERTLT